MPDAVAELASTLRTSPTLTHEQRADAPPLPLPVNSSLSPSALQRGFTTGEQFPPFLLQVGSEGGREGRREGGRKANRKDREGHIHCLPAYLLKGGMREGGRKGGREGNKKASRSLTTHLLLLAR